jgi:transcriptional regulator GlxA family with amidase domain
VLIDIVVFDGVDELDAIGPLEVFRSAERLGVDLQTRLVARTPSTEIQGAYGLRLRPDASWEPGATDVVVVPGGGWSIRAEAGAWGECERGDWLPLLASAAPSRIMAGVCTGTMLLARAGVVGGRPASTHHLAVQDLAATGAQVLQDRVVDDGDLITSGGVTSGIDLALWLVERELSRDLADAVAARMEHARTWPDRQRT